MTRYTNANIMDFIDHVRHLIDHVVNSTCRDIVKCARALRLAIYEQEWLPIIIYYMVKKVNRDGL